MFKKILAVLVVAMSGFQVAFAESNSERQAIDYLMKRNETTNAYGNLHRCMLYLAEKTHNDFIDIAIREDHEPSRGCAGDPDTAPIVDRFSVSLKKNPQIKWFDIETGEYSKSYDDFLKSRAK